ncbi:MAG: AbrB/MazE/SpoVT family DNA-binding domain-containing protein [Verrucomicrobia bacterium]|nr:AbrB/MazE/SpoVT family DNA-binding domain-containing protein [Verrucomicrobiota bacterium]
MKTTLVPIGNSRGVRIPKPFIEKCGLEGELEIDVVDGAILIRSPRHPRAGWAAAFARMAREGDDNLPIGPAPATRWDNEEWEWK